MGDELDDTDFGQDFEDFAVGLAPVTIEALDPDSGAALETAEGVPAEKLDRTRSRELLPSDQRRFVFRADRLGFLPKTGDRITEEGDGTTWGVEGAELIAFDALCSATCVKKR